MLDVFFLLSVCVLRLLPELLEHEVEPVLFQSLLPPEANRRTVSNIFQRLLGKESLRLFYIAHKLKIVAGTDVILHV